MKAAAEPVTIINLDESNDEHGGIIDLEQKDEDEEEEGDESDGDV